MPCELGGLLFIGEYHPCNLLSCGPQQKVARIIDCLEIYIVLRPKSKPKACTIHGPTDSLLT
jgi:hypothetical protein